MVNIIKRFSKKIMERIVVCLIVSMLCILMVTPVFAAPNMGDVFQSILDQIVYPMVRAVGAFITIFGVISIAMANKDDNPDSKSRAIQMTVAGLVMLVIPTMIEALGLVKMITG